MNNRLIIITLLLNSILFTQSGNGGGPNAFYKIPFTPREVAMGGTGVASSSGAFSQFWNPANIIKNVGKSEEINKVTLGFIARSSGFKGDKYANHDLSGDFTEFGVLSLLYRPIPLFGAGFSCVYKKYSDIQGTDININDEIYSTGELFNAKEALIMLSVATQLSGTPIGINLRSTYFTFPQYKKFNTYGMDFGTLLNISESLKVSPFSFIAFLPNGIKNFRFSKWFSDVKFGMAIFFDKDEYNSSNKINTGISLLSNNFNLFQTPANTRININAIGGTFHDPTINIGNEWAIYISDIEINPRLGIDTNGIVAAGIGVGQVFKIKENEYGYKINFSWNGRGFLEKQIDNLSLVDNPIKLSIEFLVK